MARSRPTSRRVVSAPVKREWARGAIVNQAVGAGAVFAINLLSGYEADIGSDFRGTVRGIMQSWCSVLPVSGNTNCTIAIGVIPESLIILPGQLISAVGYKEYLWVYYRRVLSFGIAGNSDAIQYGSLSFDTNTKANRRVRQKNETYQLVIDNHAAVGITVNHWSNMLIQS